MGDVAEVVLGWRRSPARFVREALGAVPSAQQAEVLEVFGEPGARVAVKSGHGTGKSTLMSWLVLWALVCFWDVKCPVTAPTAHQLSDVLWSEVRKWGARLPSLWRQSLEVSVDTVRFRGTPGYAAARTGRKENPEALQGFHAGTLCFFVDEASGIDDVVFEVAQGALSTPGSRILMTANPTRTSGYFYNAFHRDRDRWRRFTFSCLDCERVSKEYVEEVEAQFGRDSDVFRVRVLGEFPRAGDLQFVSSAVVDAAMGRHLRREMFDFAPVVVGVDVARGGSDRSVIVVRQGLCAEVVWQGRGADLMALADKVLFVAHERGADAVMVDGTGVGAGVVDRLRQLGHSVFDVQFGGASALRQCADKRTEMWWRMREWLEGGGAVPADDDLRDDLLAPEVGYTTRGLARLERKEDMRRRGLASPDIADALAVTFAFAVAPRREARGGGVAVDDFDPFA